MIVIVDDRNTVSDAYRASFGREGVSLSGFSSLEFEGWVSGAADDDVNAIEAFLIGECQKPLGIAGAIKKKCAASVIALKDDRSLASTLEFFCAGR